MSKETPFLKLYEAVAATDGNNTFNIDTMLNANWDKIDNIMSTLNGSGVAKEKASLEYVNTHLADYVKHPGYAGSTGALANTYVVSTTPAPIAYVDGMGIVAKITVASTGASTINWNGLGAKPILDSLGNAIISGGLKAGTPYTLRYNGTSFIVQGKGGGGNAIASDLFLGDTATTDLGAIVGTNPYRVGASVTDNKLTKILSPGAIDWSNTLSGLNWSNTIYYPQIIGDSQGNIIICYNNAANSIVIVKYSKLNVLLWTQTFATSTSGYVSIGSLYVDANDNIYIPHTRNSAYDGYLVKLNSSGTILVNVLLTAGATYGIFKSCCYNSLGIYVLTQSGSYGYLRKYDFNGALITSNYLTTQQNIQQLSVDEENYYIWNSTTNTIMAYTLAGTYIWATPATYTGSVCNAGNLYGLGGGGIVKLNKANGVLISSNSPTLQMNFMPNGKIYVAASATLLNILDANLALIRAIPMTALHCAYGTIDDYFYSLSTTSILRRIYETNKYTLN